MKQQFLIIDNSENFRTRLQRLITNEWPDAVVEGIDPAAINFASGNNASDIDWKKTDVVFVDYDLKDFDGIAWLKQYAGKAAFPEVLLLSSQVDDSLAQRTREAGAHQCLPKNSLTRSKLNSAIESALAAHLEKKKKAVAAAKKREEKETQKQVKDFRQHKAAQGDKSNWHKIDGFRMLKKIGQGGMSVIYMAERESDGQQVVIKTLSFNLIDNEKTLTRSNQEFKLISRIDHPNIVRLYEHGTIGDAMFTTMEHFANGDLKQRLKRGITQQEALRYLLQIAAGLAAIHGSGIIHRDLKPGNIMFREDDSLAIIDFGISKDINSQLDLTDMGQVMGTPNYMAPEQGNSSYRPDARSDIYAVGVMLYEMLTGKKPYAAPSSAAIIYKHLHDPIPQLPNQFFEMQILIDKMMAKFPQDRIQSALDLIELINQEFRWDITLDFE